MDVYVRGSGEGIKRRVTESELAGDDGRATGQFDFGGDVRRPLPVIGSANERCGDGGDERDGGGLESGHKAVYGVGVGVPHGRRGDGLAIDEQRVRSHGNGCIRAPTGRGGNRGVCWHTDVGAVLQ